MCQFPKSVVEGCFLGALTLELLACSVHGLDIFLWSRKKKRKKASKQKAAGAWSKQSWLSKLRAERRCMSTTSDYCRTWQLLHLKGEALITSKQAAQSIPLDTVIDLLFGQLSQIVYVKHVTQTPDFNWLLQGLTLSIKYEEAGSPGNCWHLFGSKEKNHLILRICSHDWRERSMVPIKEIGPCIKVYTKLNQLPGTAVTKHWKLGGLKQQKFVIWQFWRSEVLKPVSAGPSSLWLL